jgi:hypothetical protein
MLHKKRVGGGDGGGRELWVLSLRPLADLVLLVNCWTAVSSVYQDGELLAALLPCCWCSAAVQCDCHRNLGASDLYQGNLGVSISSSRELGCLNSLLH